MLILCLLIVLYSKYLTALKGEIPWLQIAEFIPINWYTIIIQ